MAELPSIDSNVTGLRYAEETSIGVLPVTPDWKALEPNEYDDFGGELTLLARDPINDSRQRLKGVITDLDASGGFNSDLTKTNLRDLFQGVFFANLRNKGVEPVTAVDVDGANPDEYEVASTTGFLAGSLIYASGFTNGENNGLKLVTAITANTSVEVADGSLTAEGSPPATAQIQVVGFQAAAGDIDVSVTGNYARYTSTTLDFTTLGLVRGEFIFVGGDSASLRFTNAANNGFKRVRDFGANFLLVDKSELDMVTEASTTETVQIYLGIVLKNEVGSNIVRHTYQLERSLGAPETTQPSQIQGEYLVGAIPNETTINIATADKITVDMSFVGIDNEQRVATVGLKSGNRPVLVSEDAFNTSSDFSRLRMAIVDAADEAPAPLFTFLTELNISVNNNVTPKKAVSRLGAFDVTAGTFEVSAEITAYFNRVEAIQAVRNNADVTLDAIIVKSNGGMAIDIPLIGLGNGRLDVEKDQAIMLPLDAQAATAAKIDANLNHTLLMCFYDYLPSLADV